MTPKQRGEKVAAAVLENIAPRLARWLAPVDLDELAADVEREIAEALTQDRGELFKEVGGGE